MYKDIKVVVSSNDFPEIALKLLQKKEKSSNFGEEGITENKAELLNIIPGATALVWVSKNPITKELLDKAGPELKVVSTASYDYDHCNRPELMARGINLANTYDLRHPAVAELAVGLILAVTRRFTENLDQVYRGVGEMSFQKHGQDLEGSTVGIIGDCSIRYQIIKRLEGFKVARVIYPGAAISEPFLIKRLISFHTLLTDSDFLVLAGPLTDKTHHMINSTTLAKMKKNAILINVGHGDLVDQNALYEALKNGDIYGAGLDVTSPEPLPKDHKLLTLPNLFVLPHVGDETVTTYTNLCYMAAENLWLWKAGRMYGRVDEDT